MSSGQRPGLVLAFGGFVLIGVVGGATGVVIPSQLADYHVDRITIGLTFFTFSAGYLLASVANSLLIRRLGVRGQLAAGTAVLLASALGMGTRPPFAVLAGMAAVLGFGAGVIDSGLNAYVTTLPGHTALLNYLHAFFGIGALIGPVLAAAMLDPHLLHRPWPQVYLVLAALAVPVLVGALVLLPRRVAVAPRQQPHMPVRAAVRRPEVLLAALFLFGYVGLEASVGNWGFSYVTDQRGQGALLAGWVVSGYWLGLTLGRFVLGALAARTGVGVPAMVYGCLAGVCLSVLVVWFGPGAALATAGFALLGFFLGPVFPTMIAALPQLTRPDLVSSAIGLLIGASVVGGAALPFAAGALAQRAGVGSLPPYLLALGLASLLAWWRIAVRISHANRAPGSVANRAPDSVG